jgi:hypothetical protein
MPAPGGRASIYEMCSTIFLVSPATLDGGGTQWMELAYSDAFEVPTFVVMHHLTYQDLTANDKGIPPLLLSSQCNPATDWQRLIGQVRTLITGVHNQ